MDPARCYCLEWVPPAECPGCPQLSSAIFNSLSLATQLSLSFAASSTTNHCPIINSWVWILSLPFQYLHHQGQNSNFWIHFLFSLWNFIFCDCYGWVRSRAQVPGQQLWPELCHYLPIFGFDRWDHGWTKVTCSRHQKQFPTKYDNHNLPNPYLIKIYLFRIPFLIKNSNLPAPFTHYRTLHVRWCVGNTQELDNIRWGQLPSWGCLLLLWAVTILTAHWHAHHLCSQVLSQEMANQDQTFLSITIRCSV